MHTTLTKKDTPHIIPRISVRNRGVRIIKPPYSPIINKESLFTGISIISTSKPEIIIRNTNPVEKDTSQMRTMLDLFQAGFFNEPIVTMPDPKPHQYDTKIKVQESIKSYEVKFEELAIPFYSEKKTPNGTIIFYPKTNKVSSKMAKVDLPKNNPLPQNIIPPLILDAPLYDIKLNAPIRQQQYIYKPSALKSLSRVFGMLFGIFCIPFALVYIFLLTTISIFSAPYFTYKHFKKN